MSCKLCPIDFSGKKLPRLCVPCLHDKLASIKVDATRASAELRHAYRAKDDWGLIARAIEILEKAVVEAES